MYRIFSFSYVLSLPPYPNLSSHSLTSFLSHLILILRLPFPPYPNVQNLLILLCTFLFFYFYPNLSRPSLTFFFSTLS